MKKTLVMIMILLVLLFSSALAEDSYYTIREIRDHGNPTSFSVPIHLTVEKPVKIAETDDPTTTTKENEKPSYLIYGLAGGCGLLLLLLLLQGFLLRKKIHRLEEDKL